MDSIGDPSSVIDRVLNLLKGEFKELRREKASLENVKAAISLRPFQPLQKVKLDVGGRQFATTLHTLTQIPDCYFGTAFTERWELELDQDGMFFIDRDPTAFPHILNFLRDYPNSTVEVTLLTPYELHMLRQEALFYNIQPLIEILLGKAPPHARVNPPSSSNATVDEYDEDTESQLVALFGDD